MQYYGPRMLFFGSPDCYKCIKALSDISRRVTLDERNFQYINGDDFDNEEIQRLCDKHEVDEYPHVEIYVNGDLKYREIGNLDIEEISDRMFEVVQTKVIKNESKPPTDESNKS